MTRPTRRLATIALSLGLAGALAACAEFGIEQPPEGSLDYDRAVTATARAYAASHSETPFVNGPMSVIASENGHLRTYLLLPCRGGDAICANGLNGPAGTLTVTEDYHLVRGLFGREFWLSPGGDGWLRLRDGTTVPLAWDSVDRPVGPWETARMTEWPPRDVE